MAAKEQKSDINRNKVRLNVRKKNQVSKLSSTKSDSKKTLSLSTQRNKELLLDSELDVNSELESFLKPFLFWAGGKRWFVENYSNFLPKRINGRYIEPFLGGGAVFFALRPKQAVLADAAEELIVAYQGIKGEYQKVSDLLNQHSQKHSKDYYYKVRSSEPQNLEERAARFIYLNRTCFNGIYRVNMAGKFNVPIGSKTTATYEDDNFKGWSSALKNTVILRSDFEPIINDAKKGDFLFVDPPYTVRHNNNGFVQYNEVLFSWQDQLRLHDCLRRAKARGVRILMTNANHQSLRDLYNKGFKQFVASRYSSIAASGTKRDRYEELIIQA